MGISCGVFFIFKMGRFFVFIALKAKTVQNYTKLFKTTHIFILDEEV